MRLLLQFNTSDIETMRQLLLGNDLEKDKPFHYNPLQKSYIFSLYTNSNALPLFTKVKNLI